MTELTTPGGHAVPDFAFGTMQWGGLADETASRAMFDACRAAGIRHFDTAWAYTDGASETLLGQFAKAERDQLYIATKARFDMGSGRKVILDSVEDSRSRLGLDQIDLFYMHRWDDETPVDETMGALAELQSKGVIRHIGVSNFAAWQVMKAQCAAQKLGTRIDVIQPMYNLVKRQAEAELLPMCMAEGITAATYSPLGGGLLTGKYRGGADGRLTRDTMYSARYAPEAMHQSATDLTTLATQLRTHPATLAIAWVARHPARPVPILSASRPDQLQPSLDGMTFELDDALYERISSLSVAPPPATDRLEEV